MLGMYAVTALLLLASAVIGSALATLARVERPWAGAPALGLATLLVACGVSARFPGDTVTAAVLALLLVAASAVIVWRDRTLTRNALLVLGGLALAGLVIASIPFIGRGRVGLLGLGLNNDTAIHLLWTESLRGGMLDDFYGIPTAYPLGPHGLLGAITTATGIAGDLAMQALLTATPVVAAFAGYALLDHLGPLRRMAGGLLAGFAYIAAAYYGQGAFKETLMGLFVLAFAAGLAQLPRGGDLRTVLLLAPPVAAALLTYSASAGVWFVAVGGIFVVLRLAAGLLGDRAHVGRLVRTDLLPLAAAAVLTLVLVAPELPRLLDFLTGATGKSGTGGTGIAPTDWGNLAPDNPIRFWAALGLWPSADFRFAPADTFRSGQLAALALGAFLYGVLWFMRRRSPAVPAAALGCLVVYLASRELDQSPYVTAKALAILGPSAVLLAAGALLAIPRRGLGRLVGIVAAGAFVAFAVQSSLLVLRAAPVTPREPLAELDVLREAVGERPTVFMGVDDYAAFHFRGVALGYYNPASYPPPEVIGGVRPEKGYSYGGPVDWDTFAVEDLDRFDYAVTIRSGYQSSPPENWESVRRTEHFELYRRNGPTRPRETLEPATAPGAVLDCRKVPAHRRLSRRDGVAAVAPEPVVVGGLPVLGPGNAAPVNLELPKGRWTLSLQYFGAEEVAIEHGQRRLELPAYMGRPGPFWRAGEIVSDGRPMQLWIRAHQVNRLASETDTTTVTALAATRPGEVRELPLEDACGEWVDWYRTDSH